VCAIGATRNTVNGFNQQNETICANILRSLTTNYSHSSGSGVFSGFQMFSFEAAFVLILFVTWSGAVAERPLFSYPSTADIDKAAAGLSGSFAMTKPAKDLLGIPAAKQVQVLTTSFAYLQVMLDFQFKLTCSPSVIRVSHQDSLGGDFLRPQLYISGEIHGDERVVSWSSRMKETYRGLRCAYWSGPTVVVARGAAHGLVSGLRS
jgi:hypothetical protein